MKLSTRTKFTLLALSSMLYVSCQKSDASSNVTADGSIKTPEKINVLKNPILAEANESAQWDCEFKGRSIGDDKDSENIPFKINLEQIGDRMEGSFKMPEPSKLKVNIQVTQSSIALSMIEITNPIEGKYKYLALAASPEYSQWLGAAYQLDSGLMQSTFCKRAVD